MSPGLAAGIGAGLLLAPLAYAGVLGWLRGQWRGLAPGRDTSPPSPLSKKEGELVANLSLNDSSLELAASSPSFLERGLGGEVSLNPRFSVLIAARDEAAHLPALLADLARQSLPPASFEVFVIDDHSADATAAIVRQTARTSPYPLRLVQLAHLPGPPTGKKAALAAALVLARAAWVVCTDADCRLGSGWLAAYAALLQQRPGARFVSGPVLLTGTGSLWQKLVGLEFAGLGGVGAATLAAGRATMCNGANLAYRRDTFGAVGGFAGNELIASGDDEFLLHKIQAAFPGSAYFLADRAAIVQTGAPASVEALLRQRVRWASKWRHYQSAAPRRLAVLVLAANVALGAGLLAAFCWPALWPWVGAAGLVKLGADAWFLGPVLGFFGRRRWLALVPLLQLAYGPYALGVGLAGLRGRYEWKGRAVR